MVDHSEDDAGCKMLLPSKSRLPTLVDLMKNIIIALDITPFDYRSPPLALYVSHWFIDINSLIDYILATNNTSIVLIISNLLNQFEPNSFMDTFPQISQVYILGRGCRDNISHQRIYGPFSDVESLFDNLLPKMIITETINYRTLAKQQSLHHFKVHHYKNIWFRLFFRILGCLKPTVVAREELLRTVQCFHQRQHHDHVAKNCDEFRQDYKKEDAIQWFVRYRFVYISLNRALRSENINQIFPYRYVINDLNDILRGARKNERANIRSMVYRGQQMYRQELTFMVEKIGDIIASNSFWTASHNIFDAWFVARDTFHWTDQMQKIVFCIQIPESLSQSAYVDTWYHCENRRPHRLIFPLHSLFRVEHVKIKDDIWWIDLTLIDENDNDILQMMGTLSFVVELTSFFTSPILQHTFFQDVSKEDSNFIHFQLLIDMILRLDHNHFSRDEMVEMCKEYYANDPTVLDEIKIFEEKYESKDAATWYSKNSFLYRLLNKSLRESNIDVIVKLRHFIYDLHNQLFELQMEFLHSLQNNGRILTVYRGLCMTKEQLNKYLQHQNHYVSTNSFLSTTQDYQAACFFSGEGKIEDSHVSVIYEIFVDLKIKHSLPFASIEYESIYKDEDEVLFSIGAIFHIGTIEKTNEGIWKIPLTLTPCEEGHWNILTQHLRESHE